jgi:hypothetical protein
MCHRQREPVVSRNAPPPLHVNRDIHVGTVVMRSKCNAFVWQVKTNSVRIQLPNENILTAQHGTGGGGVEAIARVWR